MDSSNGQIVGSNLVTVMSLQIRQLLLQYSESSKHNGVRLQASRGFHVEVKLLWDAVRVEVRLVLVLVQLRVLTFGPFVGDGVGCVTKAVVRVVFESNATTRVPFCMLLTNPFLCKRTCSPSEIVISLLLLRTLTTASFLSILGQNCSQNNFWISNYPKRSKIHYVKFM